MTVVVELMARFDEERNIRWARALEEAGAHVIYGIRGLKVHAKCCLVVRRTPQGIRRYVHIGTGNYNHRTARLYTDIGLLTSSPDVGVDASAFFNALTGYSDPPRMRKLVMSPSQMRDRVLKLIEREIRRAMDGQPALIRAKMNALVDERVIEALYRASRAGVRVRLNVRGICVLRPGVKGLSENIDVVSIVGRFLEHARHLPLPQRRRGRGVPVERGLDAAQPRPPHRADGAHRGARLPPPRPRGARHAVQGQREGAAALGRTGRGRCRRARRRTRRLSRSSRSTSRSAARGTSASPPRPTPSCPSPPESGRRGRDGLRAAAYFDYKTVIASARPAQ